MCFLIKKALGFGHSHILRDVQPRAILTCNLCYTFILYAKGLIVNHLLLICIILSQLVYCIVHVVY